MNPFQSNPHELQVRNTEYRVLVLAVATADLILLPLYGASSRVLATPDLFSEPGGTLQEIEALIFICGGSAIQRQADIVQQ